MKKIKIKSKDRYIRKGWPAILMALCMMLGLSGCGAYSVDTLQEDRAIYGQETDKPEIPALESPVQESGAPEYSVPESPAPSDSQAEYETLKSEPTAAPGTSEEKPDSGEYANAPLDEAGSYTSAEDVALYLETYDELPDNFITKEEARDLGWSGGSLEPYAPGMCIGGDYFGNYEGVLPEGEYWECDIDTLGARGRGAKRLVYSEDGRIYYTEDHYETFTLLYGEE